MECTCNDDDDGAVRAVAFSVPEFNVLIWDNIPHIGWLVGRHTEKDPDIRSQVFALQLGRKAARQHRIPVRDIYSGATGWWVGL